MQNTPRPKRRPSFGGFLTPSQTPSRIESMSPLKTAEERSRSFEEWLKISADNVICTNPEDYRVEYLEFEFD
jgi:hypothetical protein